jgi:NAD-dependent deacetylase
VHVERKHYRRRAMSAELDEVRAWIDEAERVVVLTGAGISTDSGIPDFRGPQGLWTKDPKAEKSAHIDVYMSDPEVRKRSWQTRIGWAERNSEPNAGHLALVELERRGKLDAIVTQNIDGLHQAAGSDPDKVIEIHGTMREVMCMTCDERAPMERAIARVKAGEEDPPCRTCGGILKSATISFGQNLVREDLERSDRAALGADLLLAVGSTLAVYPAAGLVPVAKRAGARIVIVNAEPTEMDHIADAVLRGWISEILPAILRDGSPAPQDGARS